MNDQVPLITKTLSPWNTDFSRCQSVSHNIPQIVFHCSTLINPEISGILCHVNW